MSDFERDLKLCGEMCVGDDYPTLEQAREARAAWSRLLPQIRDARNAALEEAAKAVDGEMRMWRAVVHPEDGDVSRERSAMAQRACRDAAARIRSMKVTP